MEKEKKRWTSLSRSSPRASILSPSSARYLIPALDVVGNRFEKKEIFVPEMMIAAKSMQACVDLLKPLIKKEQDMNLGTVVIGTVFGDLHDIGKNLVRLLLESSGFKVVDLGVNVAAPKFIEAARNHQRRRGGPLFPADHRGPLRGGDGQSDQEQRHRRRRSR